MPTTLLKGDESHKTWGTNLMFFFWQIFAVFGPENLVQLMYRFLWGKKKWGYFAKFRLKFFFSRFLQQVTGSSQNVKAFFGGTFILVYS